MISVAKPNSMEICVFESHLSKGEAQWELFCRSELVWHVYLRSGNVFSQVVQLEELLTVRHSVFVVGNAGTGKSQVLRSLNKTYQIMKQRPLWADLNPKAVTNDELFGIINPVTREWKDGKLYFHA